MSQEKSSLPTTVKGCHDAIDNLIHTLHKRLTREGELKAEIEYLKRQYADEISGPCPLCDSD